MIGRRRGRPAQDGREKAHLAHSWQVISLLLDYPSEELLGRLPLLSSVIAQLPEQVRGPLTRLCEHLGTTEPLQLQRDYVETFDTTRRCCLYLTYFAHGDTRKRGLALLQFKHAYRRRGVELAADELPDHLAVVLEFGAAHDLDLAWKLLNEHRAGLELLRIALQERGSAWADAVIALSATLPALRGEESQALQRLIQEGPPGEEVGLDLTPYALDPHLSSHSPSPSPQQVNLGTRIPVGGQA